MKKIFALLVVACLAAIGCDDKKSTPPKPVTKTPDTHKTPDVTKTPDTHKTPDVTKTPDVHKTPDAHKTPDKSKPDTPAPVLPKKTGTDK